MPFGNEKRFIFNALANSAWHCHIQWTVALEMLDRGPLSSELAGILWPASNWLRDGLSEGKKKHLTAD